MTTGTRTQGDADSRLAVTLIDNYDSFTWNLWHYLGELGCDVTVVRNDTRSADEILADRPDAIVLSPGPCTPAEAGICCELVTKAVDTMPLFGVCLGHQAIGEALGGRIARLDVPMHGKVSQIAHEGGGVFRGINGPFSATRYHSLVVDPSSLPDDLEVTAHADGGVIMGLSHRTSPIHGVQFHPESIASENGHRLLRNFLELAREWNAGHGSAVR